MPIIQLDVRELDRRAVERSIDVVRLARPQDLARPTPCAGWLLGDLLRHMTAQHHGFAVAAEGRGAELASWRFAADDLDVDPVAAYVNAAQQVIRAFHAEDVLMRTFRLPEISATFELPAAQAIGLHFLDYVVHGWDVARTLSQDYLLDDELAPDALRIALKVPDGPERRAESTAFSPGLPTRSGLSPLDQILRALGRDSAWPTS